MTQNQINLLALQKMFEDLATHNWAGSQDVLPLAFCLDLADECQKLYDNNYFQQASIGHKVSKTVRTDVRGDSTLWIDEDNSSPLQKKMLHVLGVLQQQLNQDFYLSLKRFETHFAVYPPGAGYEKHIDNHRGSGARKVTFILYLNKNWRKGDGGELSIFDPTKTDQVLTQIEPRIGTLVLFRSDLFPHEVEKSFKPRLSITGWFRDDIL